MASGSCEPFAEWTLLFLLDNPTDKTMTATAATSTDNTLHAALSAEEIRHSRREVRRQKIRAFFLVLPLLAFLAFAFVAPIATMLYQSVYSPTVSSLIPDTLKTLENWNGQGVPTQETMAQMVSDLARMSRDRSIGRFAEEINRTRPGASSAIKRSARQMARLADDTSVAEQAAALTNAHKNWQSPDFWQAIKDAGRVYKSRNFLTALDLETGPDGGIQIRKSARIYVQLYTKTLKMALIITILTIVLGYPLSFYLAQQSPKRANLLIIFVLLPFWTSLLVRTTAWIALLQTNGVANSTLMATGIISEPLELLYTEFSTILAMTHILLPFMILPLYAVMKGVDPSYMRAAMSMGAKPLRAFYSVYLPNTMPGLSAGALLVFIISVGYYITPALVGGTDGQMISNIIAFHMQQSNNWELAAALGSLLLILILALYWLYDRLVGADNIKLG